MPKMGDAMEEGTLLEWLKAEGDAVKSGEVIGTTTFMDIQPVNAGHVLVVPRTHYESLADVPPDLARHLFDVALKLAPIVQRLAGAGGLNVIVNSGEAAGQDVFHYHVHVIPRRADDGFSVNLPFPGSSPPDRTLLDAMAVRIIAELRDPARSTAVAA